MDLSKGVINGYDIMLKGTKSDDKNKTIIIDSSSNTTPLKIGKDFSVGWDGTLTCYKLNEISNVDNEQQYAININDIFYVTKGGGAGGSGVSFSGGFSGGFYGTARGKGIFSELTVGDEDGGTSSLNGTTTIKGKLTLPATITVGSTEMRSRTNDFVTAIDSLTCESISVVTSVWGNKNSSSINLPGGTAYIPYGTVVTSVGSSTGKAIKKITLILKTLRGAYLGDPSWKSGTAPTQSTTAQ